MHGCVPVGAAHSRLHLLYIRYIDKVGIRNTEREIEIETEIRREIAIGRKIERSGGGGGGWGVITIYKKGLKQ